MTLNDLLASANAVTDDALTFDAAFHFINDCIAKINIECDSIYPTYTANDSNATSPLPEKWQTALFVPFISAKIKQMDSSKFEFDEYFNEFNDNLTTFKQKYTIPDAYVDPDAQGGYDANFDGNWNTGNWQKGGSPNDPFSI
jgi:hypothetical protein